MRFSLLALLAACGLGASSATAAELKAGDEAPAFSLPGSDGKTYNLADFKGQQAVVVAWYPKAFTGGCTNECKSLRESGAALKPFNVAYFTASCDTAETNKKFAESLMLDYPILSDPDGKTAEAYGLIKPGGPKFPARWTFYIGADGKLLYVDRSVKTGSHGADVAAKLAELGVAKK